MFLGRNETRNVSRRSVLFAGILFRSLVLCVCFFKIKLHALRMYEAENVDRSSRDPICWFFVEIQR